MYYRPGDVVKYGSCDFEIMNRLAHNENRTEAKYLVCSAETKRLEGMITNVAEMVVCTACGNAISVSYCQSGTPEPFGNAE